MLPVMFQSRMVSYAHEPCLETGLSCIETCKALKGFQQSVLCYLLGFFLRRNQAGHHSQHLLGISACELTEQLCMSVKDVAYEQRLVLYGLDVLPVNVSIRLMFSTYILPLFAKIYNPKMDFFHFSFNFLCLNTILWYKDSHFFLFI